MPENAENWLRTSVVHRVRRGRRRLTCRFRLETFGAVDLALLSSYRIFWFPSEAPDYYIKVTCQLGHRSWPQHMLACGSSPNAEVVSQDCKDPIYLASVPAQHQVGIGKRFTSIVSPFILNSSSYFRLVHHVCLVLFRVWLLFCHLYIIFFLFNMTNQGLFHCRRCWYDSNTRWPYSSSMVGWLFQKVGVSIPDIFHQNTSR